MYEYHLKFWGSVENDEWVNRDLGISGKDFWFENKKSRDEFKAKLMTLAQAHDATILFAESEGHDVRKRTVARMIFTIPDGRKFPFEMDLGYGGQAGHDGLEYLFTEGNYSCDCNRSIFLHREHDDVPEMDCGESIVLEDFRVTTED